MISKISCISNITSSKDIHQMSPLMNVTQRLSAAPQAAIATMLVAHGLAEKPMATVFRADSIGARVGHVIKKDTRLKISNAPGAKAKKKEGVVRSV